MVHMFKQKNDFKNYYEVLEISTASTQKDIDEAYKQAKNTYVLDNIALHSVMTKDECKAILELVDEAYSILGSPDKRQAYDKAKGLSLKKESAPQGRKSANGKKPAERPQTNGSEHAGLGISKVAALNHFALNYKRRTLYGRKN